MKFKMIGQVVGVLALTVGLAGCIDMTMDLDIQSETNAKATTTMTMGKDFYAMAKSGMAAAPDAGAAAGTTPPTDTGFCKNPGDVLVENPDGSATCTTIIEGTFADINKGDNQNGKFEVVGPGLVKVTFSTADMKTEVASGTGSDPTQAAQDEQTKAMMAALFEGHNITIRIKGTEITETNMTKSADGTTAEIVIPFMDLINGTTTLPDELTATVKVN